MAEQYSGEPQGVKAKSVIQMILAVIGVVALAVVIFGGGAYLLSQYLRGPQEAEPVQTVKLEASTYSNPVGVDGVLRSAEGETVVPEIEGKVTKVCVEEGAEVEEGDLLFKLKNDEVTANADTCDETYQKALEESEKADKAYNKQAKVVKTAQAAYDEVSSSAEDDDTALEEAQAALTEAQEELDTLKDAQDAANQACDEAEDAYKDASAEEKKLSVKAPCSGTVASLSIEKGMTTESILASGAALRIVDVTSIIGVVEVPEEFISSVGQGQDCEVALAGADNERVNANVTGIAGAATENDDKDAETTYSVKLKFAETSDLFKDGLSITAYLELTNYGTVYYVPTSAVGDNGSTSYVETVFGDGTTKETAVTLITVTDDGEAVIKGSELYTGMAINENVV